MASASGYAAPVEYVRVCDIFGAGFYYVPGTETCLNAATGQTRIATAGGTIVADSALKAEIDQAMEDAQRALEGVAVALAMPTARVASGKTYGAAFNLAVFEGKVAVGAGAAMKIDDTFSLDGAAAIGLQHGTVGVKLGLTGRW
ncbi:porin [Devosia aurantiaca]|uniref:porin n=1 Tax=Devosia aurantiaca TaxID=2714858 RepID=UPI001F2AB79E|nr:porin [Devosia aurantiaca]